MDHEFASIPGSVATNSTGKRPDVLLKTFSGFALRHVETLSWTVVFGSEPPPSISRPSMEVGSYTYHVNDHLHLVEQKQETNTFIWSILNNLIIIKQTPKLFLTLIWDEFIPNHFQI